MRYRVPFLLLCCVIFHIVSSKPLQIEENDANAFNEEYEVLSQAASNVPDRDENDVSAGFSQSDVSAELEAVGNQADSSDMEYQSEADQRQLRTNAETFSDSKRSSDCSETLRHNSKKRFENSDLNDEIQNGNAANSNSYDEARNLGFSVRYEEPNKRAAELRARNDRGTMLFNSDDVSKIENKYNNNEELDTSEQAHLFKQYHNSMQTDNKQGLYDQTEENELIGKTRERREVVQKSIVSNVSSKNPHDSNTVDEETAIRNHIKKLSDTELKELLNSLTDEKRQLLKKIIDDTHANYDAYDNINKREITKKAGALEENNLVENVQSEISKIQPSSPSAGEITESQETPNSDPTTNKQLENSDGGNVNSDSKLEVTSSSNLNSIQPNKFNSLSSAKDTENTVSIGQESTKSENKRETNYNDFFTDDISLEDTGLADNELDTGNSPDSAVDQEYISCSQDEKKSQLDNNKVQNEKRDYKRAAYPMTLDDLPDSLKSLEESFPNSYAHGDSASYSGPLVRVKRKDINHNMKQRSAGILPQTKTGYYQYKSESEDADNDEGNEFDDDGFYDVTSNLEKNKPIDDSACDNSASQKSVVYSGLSSGNPILTNNDNVARDSVNLGSDTDAVLSGVEGVDENLMYSSNLRNRRNDDKPSLKIFNASDSSKRGNNELKTVSENYMSAPNYRENDAFGPVPRNSEGDLGRYKRIKRSIPVPHNNTFYH